jgi:hypothetical protein
MQMTDAALYEAPFEYVKTHVQPMRSTVRRARYRDRWWLHSEPCSGMRNAKRGLSRYLVTPALAKHRLFAWIPAGTLPDHQLVVIATDEDFVFGILQSRVHELWARAMGTQLREVESGFRYTPTSTFETFPFPTPSSEARDDVASAAHALDTLRSGWLNPDGMVGGELSARTLTNLYNDQPTWLVQAHERLDRAVHAAYGWAYPVDDGEILTQLLALNFQRSAV